MKLLGVSYRRAREIAGLGEGYIDPEGFDALAARLMGRTGAEEARPEQLQRRRLTLDADFVPITRKSVLTRPYWDYLFEARGFNGRSGLGEDVDVLCADYSLRAAIRGEFQGRVIIPYFMDDELVTWTGRAIGDAHIRYRDLKRSESIVPPKETFFNHDAMYVGGKALVLVEGPVDALKLDFYGKPWGVRAIALSTNSITEEQTYLLREAEGRFERVLVMLDNATSLGIVDSMRLKQHLSFLRNLSIVKVPNGAKDAGVLRPSQVIKWAQAL
jgi:hypothetical protein